MEEIPANCKIETAYNSMHLVRDRGRLELRSHDKALQSVINLDQPEHLELANLQSLVSVFLFIPAPRRVLMLGTAAGSLLHFLRHHFPEAHITAVDIDETLIQQLRQMGVLPPPSDQLEYHYGDAARFISDCEHSYDLVIFDVFDGAQTPAWLRDETTLEQLYRVTAKGGALALNLLIDSDHDFGQFYRSCQRRFNDSSLSLPVDGLENRIVFAVREARPPRDMTANIETAMMLSEQLDIDLTRILSVIYNTNPSGRGLI